MKTLAELINSLFDTHRKPNGDRYTNKEVSEALGGAIDQSNLSLLRNGKSINPGRLTLLHLCRFFDVTPSYFFPELEPPEDEASKPPQKNSSGVLLLRTPDNLSPKAKKRLDDFLQALDEQEQDTQGDDSEE